ncbi:MAG: hypothetical protein IJ841_00885 [Prevotella sp.]|nr:hypothetical protein [Prevotella sp.]
MPNWCQTSYTIEGNPLEITTFVHLLKELEQTADSAATQDYGRLRMEDVVTKLGGDSSVIYCRGKITDFQERRGLLLLDAESAWIEMVEWRHFIASRFPSFRFYYVAEESGNALYLTNDREGKYYHDRYFLDDIEGGSRYFETLQEACEYVSTLTGRSVSNVNAIKNAIAEYCDQEGYDDISFYEFRITFD